MIIPEPLWILILICGLAIAFLLGELATSKAHDELCPKCYSPTTFEVQIHEIRKCTKCNWKEDEIQ